MQELTLAQLLADESAGIDFSRVVHGDQRFRFSRPIVAGDLLTATMTVTDVKTLGGNAMVTAESELLDGDGGTSSPPSPRSWCGATHERASARGRPGRRRADLRHRPRPLVRYAGASGDFNPIHYRDDVATSVGLPGVLAHGMLTMGLAVQPVVERFGADRVLEYGVRFTRPVPVPPEGSVRLEVEAKVGQLVDGEARIDVTASLDGQTVLGRAQVRVASDRARRRRRVPRSVRGRSVTSVTTATADADPGSPS